MYCLEIYTLAKARLIYSKIIARKLPKTIKIRTLASACMNTGKPPHAGTNYARGGNRSLCPCEM